MSSLAALKEKLAKKAIRENLKNESNIQDVIDQEKWEKRLQEEGLKPDVWLEYIEELSHKNYFSEYTKYDKLCNAYQQAVKVISSEDNKKNGSYARLWLNYARLKGEFNPEEAESVLDSAKCFVRRFAVVHVACAEFEIKQGNENKAKKLLYKATLYAKPKYLLEVASVNLQNGLTTLIDDEQREQGFSTVFSDEENSVDEIDPCSQSLIHYKSTPVCRSKSFSLNPFSANKFNSSSHKMKSGRPMRVKLNLQSTDTIALEETMEDSTINSFKPLDSFHRTNETFGAHSSGYVSSTTNDLTEQSDNHSKLTEELGQPSSHSTIDLSIQAPSKRQCIEETSDSKHSPVNITPSKVQQTLEMVNDKPSSLTRHKSMSSTVKSVKSVQLNVTEYPSNEKENQPVDKESVEYEIPVKVEKNNEPRINQPLPQPRINQPLPQQQINQPLTQQQINRQLSQQPKNQQLSQQPMNQPLPQSQTDQPLPQSQTDQPLPQQQINQPLPQSQIYQQLPQQQMNQPFPQSQIDQPLPQQPMNKPLPQSPDQPVPQPKAHQPLPQQQQNSQIPQPNINQSLPQQQQNSQIPQPNINQSLPQQQQNSQIPQPNINQSLPQQQIHPPLPQQLIKKPLPQPTLYQPVPTPLKFGNDVKYVNGHAYSVLKIAGRGGSAKVYQVLDEKNNVRALKCVDLDGSAHVVVQGYKNEINLLKRLQYCDAVIKMYDYEFDEVNNKLNVILEYGETDLAVHLSSRKKGGKSLGEAVIKFYWQEMLSAVNALHKEGIIHSDLKPANFMFVSANLKLIDFGIADAVQQDKTSVFKDVTVGTVSYMSPEAIKESCDGQARYKISVRSDVWSLGCILYVMVYGKTPFQHIRHQLARIQAITDEKQVINFPDIPDKLLLDVLKKCLVRDVKLRPTTDDLLIHPYLSQGPSIESPVPAPKPRSIQNILSEISEFSPRSMQTFQGLVQKIGK